MKECEICGTTEGRIRGTKTYGTICEQCLEDITSYKCKELLESIPIGGGLLFLLLGIVVAILTQNLAWILVSAIFLPFMVACFRVELRWAERNDQLQLTKRSIEHEWEQDQI